VGTRITAALAAVFALLAWAAAPAWAERPIWPSGEIAGHYGARGAGAPVHVGPINAALAHQDPAHPVPGHPAPAPSNTGEIAALAAAAAALVGLAVLVGWRISGRRADRTAAAPALPATAELQARTARALIETDDAIKTSDQELGFAVASFGEHAAAPFSAALKSARAELAEAFKLRQQLDDETPEREPVRREKLAEILRRCGEANRLLDEQSAAFDRLQDLEARAPEVLAEVGHHVIQQAARLRTSEQILAKLEARYTPGAVAIVASSPSQAHERLEFARSGLTNAQHALSSDETGQAAVFLQAAGSAADQAESLLNEVEHREAELTQAASALPAALREIDAEIAEATAPLAGRSDDRAEAVSGAQATASNVRARMRSGAPFDALTALRDLERADAALDRALASSRAERDRQDRAGAVLDQVMLVARSAIKTAEDFITTRRGGVGATARTRLAEAGRHFQQAIASGQDNPEAAVSEAQLADALAQDARALAENDVAQFSDGQQARVGESGGRHDLGGAILGGILIDSVPGAGRAGPRGGGFRLGGFGTPGSFGGIDTRRRHSIGGMS
jgi:hypothetical protein